MTRARRPRVAVVGTGGTIAFVGRDALDLFEYVDQGRCHEIEELIARFPDLATQVELVPVRYKAISSTAVGPSEWLALLSLIHGVASDDARLDGIVVTHGTATLEETA
jgi:L-asparaginase